MRDVDAVGRRAVHAVDAVVDRLEPQGTAERERVTDRARFFDGRDDGDVAERPRASASTLMPSDR